MDVINEALALGISPNQVGLIGESGGACIALGVAQMLVKTGQEELAHLMILSWPMVGDFLCGGPKPNWTLYELSIKD